MNQQPRFRHAFRTRDPSRQPEFWFLTPIFGLRTGRDRTAAGGGGSVPASSSSTQEKEAAVGCHGGLAAPGAIAVSNATNEPARVDSQRPPDDEPTPVLRARTRADVPGSRSQFSKHFCDFYFAFENILTNEFRKN